MKNNNIVLGILICLSILGCKKSDNSTPNPSPSHSSSGNITTIAGNGTPGFSGDGGAASAAVLNSPTCVAVDASGNIYIADASNSRIRKISNSGTITTIAGNGTPGFSGDGGPATSAQLLDPTGVIVDASGNLYISDIGNYRVRCVSVSGIITTIAGNGASVYNGDNISATTAAIYPTGIAIDASGTIYIADETNNRIRYVSGGKIYTLAGNGTGGFSGDGGLAVAAELYYPSGVALDASGNMYISDYTNCRIRKVNASGIISTIAGNGTPGYSGDGGAAIAAEIFNPGSVSLDASGNLYISDGKNCVIRKISTSGIITTIAGNGSLGFSGDGGVATIAMLNTPRGVTIDVSGNIYIADQNNHRVRKVSN